MKYPELTETVQYTCTTEYSNSYQAFNDFVPTLAMPGSIEQLLFNVESWPGAALLTAFLSTIYYYLVYLHR